MHLANQTKFFGDCIGRWNKSFLSHQWTYFHESWYVAPGNRAYHRLKLNASLDFSNKLVMVHCIKSVTSKYRLVDCIKFFFVLSAGSDKNHAGDSTWWSTKLDDFHFTER